MNPIHARLFATATLGLLLFVSGCGDDALTGDVDVTGVDTLLAPDTTLDPDAIVIIDTHSPVDTIPGEDGATDTAEPIDTARTCDDDPKPFFCPCVNNVQCESNYCVPVDETEVAARCSKLCDATCPNGWDCRGVSGTGDTAFICQPPVNNLCKACNTDANCGSAGDKCIEYEDGKYCGRNCQAGAPECPTNYSCAEILNDVGQIEAYQCAPVSGSCNCEPGVDYDNDPLNCGGCHKACAYPGGVPGCQGGICVLDGCQAGFVDLDGVRDNGCEYACTKTSDDDWPDATCSGSSCDQDCDGIDGSYVRAIFVATTGSRQAQGTAGDPVDTIGRGIQLAQSQGRDHVYVAAGQYNEQVTLVEGVSVFGGYSNDGRWTRNLAQYTTTITSSSGTNSIRAVIADGIQTTRTVLDGVTAIGGNNGNPGGSSYGIWVRGCNSKLELANVNAIGGNGGAGSAGSNGNPGNPGNDAVAGSAATDYDCMVNGCNWDSFAGKGGAGAANACSTGINTGGGAGASVPACATGGNTGATSPSGVPGGTPESAGTNGGSRANAASGAGGLGAGTVSGGFWSGNNGANGTAGDNGYGGGGGGSGKNTKGAFWACVSNTYRYGGGGGGGGGGGCGGTAGKGGTAGGGSFGVFLHDASPKIIASKLGHRSGGNGGAGGDGGVGGAGKAGKGGGEGHCGGGGCGSAGAKGGDGGKGGNGGHGGGGAGGVAYGLYLAGSSSPSCSGLAFDPPGAGGTGGLGGPSSGNKGADGPAGDRNKTTGSCP